MHDRLFLRTASRRLRLGLLCFALAVVVWGESCNCESESIGTAVVLEVKVAKPAAGPVSGDVPVEISVVQESDKQPVGDLRMVHVLLTPQGDSDQGERKIAELHKAPYRFRWSSIQADDGFYLLKAIAYDAQGQTHDSKRVLIQVVNTPPELWFVNCNDGQFVRGVYSLVVSLHRPKTELKAPPLLSINGQEGPKTADRRHPYRYSIDTRKFKEGEQLSLSVSAEDLKGNSRRIVCRPRVDNLAPTIRFVKPSKDGVLLGRQFKVEFDAFDQFGVQEVRLWVDGSACPQSSQAPDPSCEKTPVWSSKAGPSYGIQVQLSEDYDKEQTILLTARAVDQAGNATEPPARLRIRIDPVAPEIFIRSPGQGELIDKEVKFIARITDNDNLKSVTITVEGGSKPVVLAQKSPGVSELTLELSESDATKAYGRGRRTLVVEAVDPSGNKTVVRRLFNVGCTDAADCEIGKVCHKSLCKTPVGLNEACDDDKPCGLDTSCVPGKAPVCSRIQETFCRLRCHPGNKVVSPDRCPNGFYCSKATQTCMPSDGCTPLGAGCKGSEQCVPVDDDSGFCLPRGPVGLGQPCQEDCQAQGNCQDGLWCVFNQGSGQHLCLRACDTRSGAPCPSGGTCQRLAWSFGGEPLVYGVCIPPR